MKGVQKHVETNMYVYMYIQFNIHTDSWLETWSSAKHAVRGCTGTTHYRSAFLHSLLVIPTVLHDPEYCAILGHETALVSDKIYPRTSMM